MTEEMKTIVLVYPSGYRTKRREKTVEYPASHILSYDTNQACLQIKHPSGEPVAVFRGCQEMIDESVITVGEISIIDEPWREDA